MNETTGILVLIFSMASGYVAADLTPGVRGIGAATFAALFLIIIAIHHAATRKAKR